MSRFTFAAVVGTLALAACSSGNSGGGTTSGGYTITISNYKFSPDPLVVPAGATITVKNEDVSSTSAHTATSEASAGSYDGGMAPNGFFFDTGDIDAGDTATIKVPANAASGTTQPYFCKVHTSMMASPTDPVIEIQ